MKDAQVLQAAFSEHADDSSDVQSVCGLHPPTVEEVWQKIKDSPAQVWQMAVDALGGLPLEMPAIPDLPQMPELKWPEMPDFSGFNWKLWE
jgi:hypothetical protein